MKKALILCASHNDLGSIKALKELGFYVIGTGNRENAPGEILLDKWIKADYSDMELILQISKNEKIDRICACCNDFGVYTAAYVAEKIGLPGYDSYETTLSLHNKDLFKKLALEIGITTPRSIMYDNIDNAYNDMHKFDFPVIVKPVDCSAGNGVDKVSDCSCFKDAIDKAMKKSRLGRIVVENYIEGTQHGFCTFLVNQKVVAFCSNDEYSIQNPYRVEIDTFPATDHEKYAQILINQIEQIAARLKLKDGIFHLQYIVNNGVPWIIEVMRRTVGNMYHVLGNRLNNICWEYWESKARCGISCNEFPNDVTQEGYYAYKTILATSNGVIDKINIPHKYEKYIFKKYLLMDSGDEISDCKNQPVGFLFMKFLNSEEMYHVLIKDYECDFVEVI